MSDNANPPLITTGVLQAGSIKNYRFPTQLDYLIAEAQNLVRASGQENLDRGDLDVCLTYSMGEAPDWQASICCVNYAVSVGEGAKYYSNDAPTAEEAVQSLIEVLKEEL